MSYCKIIAMGRLTADPELRNTPQGTPVCDCRLAFDNGWGDNKRTCFVDVTVWGKQADFVKKYFQKGSGIVVDGRLELDQWEDKTSGQKRSKHYITAERVTFPVGSKNESGGGGGYSDSGSNRSQAAGSSSSSQGGWGNDPSVDEIPF